MSKLRGADLQDRARQMEEVLPAQAIKAAAEQPRRACHPAVNPRE